MPEIFFNGPVGRIEGRYIKSEDSKSPIALVLHSDPTQGGNMNDKVVYSIYKTLANLGFTVLRINFRGVGLSQGQFDNGIGEMLDVATAIDWLQNDNPLSQGTIVAGFSFGAWIGMQLTMRRPDVSKFIAVSPPVSKRDFSFLTPSTIRGIILHGTNDSIIPQKDVEDLAKKILAQQYSDYMTYKIVDGADHFFREKLNELSFEIKKYFKESNEHHDEDNNNISDKKQKTTKKQQIFLE
jgi:alpha/beta superfamily hydrolase